MECFSFSKQNPPESQTATTMQQSPNVVILDTEIEIDEESMEISPQTSSCKNM